MRNETAIIELVIENTLNLDGDVRLDKRSNRGAAPPQPHLLRLSSDSELAPQKQYKSIQNLSSGS